MMNALRTLLTLALCLGGTSWVHAQDPIQYDQKYHLDLGGIGTLACFKGAQTAQNISPEGTLKIDEDANSLSIDFDLLGNSKKILEGAGLNSITFHTFIYDSKKSNQAKNIAIYHSTKVMQVEPDSSFEIEVNKKKYYMKYSGVVGDIELWIPTKHTPWIKNYFESSDPWPSEFGNYVAAFKLTMSIPYYSDKNTSHRKGTLSFSYPNIALYRTCGPIA